MIPPRLGMSCAGSVAVPTCPVMPILPPHHTRRSQAVQSLSPPVILALSWPQSKIKNSAVVVTTCAVSTSTSKLSENIQFGRCNHPGCMCISLPSQPYYHDVLWWVFGLSVQSWLLTEWGKVWTQDRMNRNYLKCPNSNVNGNKCVLFCLNKWLKNLSENMEGN